MKKSVKKKAIYRCALLCGVAIVLVATNNIFGDGDVNAEMAEKASFNENSSLIENLGDVDPHGYGDAEKLGEPDDSDLDGVESDIILVD